MTITRKIIEQLPQLKFISQTGRNVYHLDAAACTDHGILVSAGGHDGKSPYTNVTTRPAAYRLMHHAQQIPEHCHVIVLRRQTSEVHTRDVIARIG